MFLVLILLYYRIDFSKHAVHIGMSLIPQSIENATFWCKDQLSR